MTKSPLIQRVKHNLDHKMDGILISIACGVIFAALTIAFFR